MNRLKPISRRILAVLLYVIDPMVTISVLSVWPWASLLLRTAKHHGILLPFPANLLLLTLMAWGFYLIVIPRAIHDHLRGRRR